MIFCIISNNESKLGTNFMLKVIAANKLELVNNKIYPKLFKSGKITSYFLTYFSLRVTAQRSTVEITNEVSYGIRNS